MPQLEDRVEVVGHATLLVRSGGRTLLTDPWLIDPITCDSGFHFPPLVHDLDRLIAATDAIYLSHVHPDHFHPPSLALFPKHVPIYIGDYRHKRFRSQVEALGLRVIEVPFQRPVTIEGTPLEITIIEHDDRDSAAYDSALLVRAPEFTLFENNDCYLSHDRYAWVRAQGEIDYAFLGYSPASSYPICFEMDSEEKERLLAEAAERRYRDFVDTARILQPRLSVPFASGLRFLRPHALWMNVAFNSASEAVARLAASGLAGDVLGPGDCIDGNGAIRRVSAVLDRHQELAAIAQHSRRLHDWIDALGRRDRRIDGDLIERFATYMVARWRSLRQKFPEISANVIAYRVIGEQTAHFYFDFSRAEADIFQWGEPRSYDMRYTYPAGGLQARLDGEIDWDELHFTDEVSVHQVKFARQFYLMLRHEVLDSV